MAYEELPPVEEAKALLVQPAPAPAATADKFPPRAWRGHWMHIFGKGSPEDLTACCMAYNAPCVAFGWNHRRGLGLGFWCETFKFVALVGLMWAIMQGISVTLNVRCGPQMPPRNGGPFGRPFGGDAGWPGATSDSGPGMMGGGAGGAYFGNDAGIVEDPFVNGERGASHGIDMIQPDEAIAFRMGGDQPLPGTKGKPCNKGKQDPAFMADVAQRAAVNTVSAVGPADSVNKAVLTADDPTVAIAATADVYYVDERPSVVGPAGSDPFSMGHMDRMDHMAGGSFGGPHDHPIDLLDPMCVHAMLLSPGVLAMFALLFVASGYMAYYTALRRRQLRERFGIPGSFWQDYCLWTWCSVCALAQETRTLMHNHVHDGVWYGEVPGAAHQQLHYAAPAPQQIPAAGPLMV